MGKCVGKDCSLVDLCFDVRMELGGTQSAYRAPVLDPPYYSGVLAH